MNETFMVRVISSREECYWYNRHIGETFMVKCVSDFWETGDNGLDYIIMNNEYPEEGVLIDCAAICCDDCIRLDTIVPHKYIEKHKI